ncbi:MAG TPA: FAD-dependent oxidoreductase [Candidatus Limnocylindria bacterium]|nr:FAD-dependent oxidoreductase [Candidatus Limnocylindria bacterium]
MAHPDFLIVGGGIIGCSAAAFAAELGASVLLLEATGIGAGASGRNSGAVQHPFDAVLAELHHETLRMYRELADGSRDFAFPAQPAGLLLLTDDEAGARSRVAELNSAGFGLAAEYLDETAVQEAEPMVAPGWAAVRLATGYPIPPDAATRAFAARAAAAGAELRTGARVAAVKGRAVGLQDGSTLEAGAVLVAVGPWSSDLLAGSAAAAIRPTYGVTLQVSVPDAPRSVLEEGAVHTVNRPVGDDEPNDGLVTFSMVSVGGTSTVGSTFLARAADPTTLAPQLLANGARFVPALAGREVLRSRVCARPQSPDGRPFIGPLDGSPGTFVAAGHGPWGISTGPASAALAVASILDGGEIPAALEAGRAI